MKPIKQNHICQHGKFQRIASLVGLMVLLPGFITRAAMPVELHAFPNPDFLPAGLVQGPDGNFYGTMHQTGPGGYGAVYQMTPGGAVTTLYSFSGTYGADPKSRLIVGADGNFYGVTQSGGTNGCGTVFQLTPAERMAGGGSIQRSPLGTFTTLFHYTLVHFNGTNGASPFGELVQGTDGNFYGTTQSGGTGNSGTVFQVTPSGALTTLASFTGGNGAVPWAGLVQGVNGNFYGTTQSGGISNRGTIFQITTGGTLTSLASFRGTNGSYPTGKLLQGADGNFYGTTYTGGKNGCGTVFRVTTNGALTTLASFNGINGFGPRAGLTLGGDGNMYGATVGGGTGGYGTVFQVTPSGTLNSLVSFNGANGSGPDSPLLLAADGNFYGTTESSIPGGNGTVFKLSPNGTLTTLAYLNSIEGANPHAGLLLGTDGNYYGTTEYGGTNNCGTVFQLTSAGTVNTLAAFNFTNGAYPMADLALGSNGVFYGMTCDGGASNLGTIFSLAPGGALTTLVSFNGTNGSYPEGGLVLGTNGLFYGTTFRGGSNDCGTVFQVTTNGVLTSLVSFNFSDANGFYPSDGLTPGWDGYLYGVNYSGGASSYGTAFKMSYSGVISGVNGLSSVNGNPVARLTSGWNLRLYGSSASSAGGIFDIQYLFFNTASTLYTFSGTDGSSPTAALVQGSDGNFYGTTEYGGTGGCGTMFQITPAGAFTSLFSFGINGTNNGASPDGELVQGANGNFYGTTSSGGSAGGGNIFLLMTNSSSIAPVVIFQPTNETILVGVTAAFTVLAGGDLPLSYQWQLNGTNLDGATSANLILNNVQPAQAGNYSVVVTNAAGLMISSNAVLVVQDASPAITFQPAPQAVATGGTAIFNVQVAGSLPFYFQWSCNGTNLVGATNASLTLNNVQPAQMGNYSVVVTNLPGSAVSSNALLSVYTVPAFIAASPVSQEAPVGSTVELAAAAGGTLPLAYQWSCNGTNLVGATNVSLTLTNLQSSQAGTYAVAVTNAYGAATSSNAVLLVAIPSVPDSFNPGANGNVYCVAAQTDGKIVVGGSFTTLGGQSRANIGRLNADGTLDTNFNPGAGSTVYSLAVQTDGKIVVGGTFSTLGGQSHVYLGRLNTDGTPDTNFNPGASSTVNSLALQADGKILFGGSTIIRRLNADGTLDFSYSVTSGLVYSLALQADGKILVGGTFTRMGGQNHVRIGRLNADGTLDAGFNPGASNTVYSVAVQADGKILLGGIFSMLNGSSCTNIGRLNADGTLDVSFNSGATNRSGQTCYVYSLALEADGGILVGGAFTSLGGQSCTNIGRLNSDGTLDGNFYPGANSTVYSVAVQSDGKVLAGGAFATLGGQSRSYLGRLTPTVSAPQSLTFNGSTINWQRGGSCPEACGTSFDAATNGTSWTALGAGTRVAGGWQLTGLGWPTNASLRARGIVAGGQYSGSAWYVQTLSGPPIITNQPVNQTVLAGGTATFTVLADGAPTLGYQWNFNGTNLAGANNATLTISNVQSCQAGNYAVLVTNNFGSVVSSNAVLTVPTMDHLTWNPIQSPQFINAPMAVALQARDAANGLFTNFNGSVSLGSTNGLAVTPPVSGNFVQGVWTGAVVVAQPVTNLVLQAVDGLGHIGLANAINVVGLPPLTTTFSGNAFFIFWPTNPAGFVLETSPDLSPGSWVPMTAIPIPTNDQYYQSIQPSGTNAFYRLRFSGY
jgi:uncharacterized delta-60 repeat protein